MNPAMDPTSLAMLDGPGHAGLVLTGPETGPDVVVIPDLRTLGFHDQVPFSLG